MGRRRKIIRGDLIDLTDALTSPGHDVNKVNKVNRVNEVL
jgi:hypothetical protein